MIFLFLKFSHMTESIFIQLLFITFCILDIALELIILCVYLHNRYRISKPAKDIPVHISFMSIQNLLITTNMNFKGCVICSILLHLQFIIFTSISIPIDFIYFIFHWDGGKDNYKIVAEDDSYFYERKSTIFVELYRRWNKK